MSFIWKWFLTPDLQWGSVKDSPQYRCHSNSQWKLLLLVGLKFLSIYTSSTPFFLVLLPVLDLSHIFTFSPCKFQLFSLWKPSMCFDCWHLQLHDNFLKIYVGKSKAVINICIITGMPSPLIHLLSNTNSKTTLAVNMFQYMPLQKDWYPLSIILFIFLKFLYVSLFRH